jgi:hypothetical protein
VTVTNMGDDYVARPREGGGAEGEESLVKLRAARLVFPSAS